MYIVESTINQKTVFGMMNIGFNPTVKGQNQSIEIHYFDFDADLYEQNTGFNPAKNPFRTKI